MLRLWPAAMVLALAACAQTSGGGAPTGTSVAGPADGSRTIGQGSTSGVTDLATRENNPTRIDPKTGNRKIPKLPSWDISTAEIVINKKTGEGNLHLMQFLMSDTWMFWSKKDNDDGTVSWTFIRPKQPMNPADRFTDPNGGGRRTSGTVGPVVPGSRP